MNKVDWWGHWQAHLLSVFCCIGFRNIIGIGQSQKRYVCEPPCVNHAFKGFEDEPQGMEALFIRFPSIKINNLDRGARLSGSMCFIPFAHPKLGLSNQERINNEVCVLPCIHVYIWLKALEDAEEVRRQALAKAAHQREQELADERARKEKLGRADARNREEERVRKAEEHRLQVR